jgi:hypothetical protein
MKRKIKSTAPEPPLHLDMPFDEALRRFIATKPGELDDKIKRPKKETAGQKKQARRRS